MSFSFSKSNVQFDESDSFYVVDNIFWQISPAPVNYRNRFSCCRFSNLLKTFYFDMHEGCSIFYSNNSTHQPNYIFNSGFSFTYAGLYCWGFALNYAAGSQAFDIPSCGLLFDSFIIDNNSDPIDSHFLVKNKPYSLKLLFLAVLASRLFYFTNTAMYYTATGPLLPTSPFLFFNGPLYTSRVLELNSECVGGGSSPLSMQPYAGVDLSFMFALKALTTLRRLSSNSRFKPKLYLKNLDSVTKVYSFYTSKFVALSNSRSLFNAKHDKSFSNIVSVPSVRRNVEYIKELCNQNPVFFFFKRQPVRTFDNAAFRIDLKKNRIFVNKSYLHLQSLIQAYPTLRCFLNFKLSKFLLDSFIYYKPILTLSPIQ